MMMWTIDLDSHEAGEAKKADIANPYNGIALLDIDGIYMEFQSYKSSVNFMVNCYAGTGAELRGFIESKNNIPLPDYTAVTADSYFRNKKVV